MTATALPVRPLRPQRPRWLPLPPAWPLTGILALYPLWWALGLGVLIFPIMAVPMAWWLLRNRPVRVPPGFGLWLLFLVAVLGSLTALGYSPAGTLPGTVIGRMPGAGFRVIEYGALTIMLLYAGNLPRQWLSQRRLITLLGWLFAVTVAGGLLGVVAGHWEFTSPVESLLPHKLRSMGFIKSLVHPSAAQIMDVLGGDPIPRPAAPWGYTNTWGNNYCLLVGWFVIASRAYRKKKWLAAAVLAASVVPVVYSLNRGLWIGLAVMAVYVAIRFAMQGRLWPLGGLAVGAATMALLVVVSPLGNLVGARLEHGKSNDVRMYVTTQALAGLRESPLIGFGSTRTTTGGRNSIAVGSSSDCERCGNFTLGGNGQLWQTLYAHGLIGTAAYFGFFGYGIWRFRRDRSPAGLAGSACLVASFSAMFWYNALVTPLAFLLLAYALLWRNDAAHAAAGRGGDDSACE
ncbi:O-antigen ligase family protein [Longispora albida]|uniref:O-antigen ligase family protein n=1 Tax=Longispora albida TaxID=203523 RepID=UPI0003820F0A|nr:O-antigen ligase family protein [Longispora albida]